jgi:hypothetical protein
MNNHRYNIKKKALYALYFQAIYPNQYSDDVKGKAAFVVEFIALF